MRSFHHRPVVIWLFLCLLLTGCTKPSAAFTVNGLAVEKAELIHYMKENAAVVAAELEDEGLDSTREDFWTAQPGGVDTFARLRDYTTRQITRQKVEQLCAADYGLETPLYYSGQLAELQAQNRQRASAYAAGEVLYGPVERDFVAYFQEWYLAMQKALRDTLAEQGVISVSPAETEAFYTAHQDYYTEYSREEALYMIRAELLDDAYEGYIDALAAAAKVQEGTAQILPTEVF